MSRWGAQRPQGLCLIARLPGPLRAPSRHKAAPTGAALRLKLCFQRNKFWICSCKVSKSNGFARIGALRVIGLPDSRISAG